jgi:ribosomal protein S18 acetylase RimI-like enzyme
MIEIHKVGIEAIPQIIRHAKASWKPTYKDILSEAQMDYMFELFYSPDALVSQIIEKQHQFIIALDNNLHAGFASYSPINKGDTSAYHLHKIYIKPTQQGKGIGKVLLDFVINDIKPKGAQYIDLNVNRYNKATDFYKKIGFEIIEEVDVPVGNNYFMNDYIMRKKL